MLSNMTDLSDGKLVLTLAAAFVACSWVGCRRSSEQGAASRRGNGRYNRLAAFIARDEFVPAPGTVYFKPMQAPEELLQYVREEYGRDARVRSLLAYYFLRYDAALLSRGLISVDARRGDLVRLLWEKEQEFGYGQAESPSTSAIREHIKRNPMWFQLNDDAKAVLDSNERRLREIIDASSGDGVGDQRGQAGL